MDKLIKITLLNVVILLATLNCFANAQPQIPNTLQAVQQFIESDLHLQNNNSIQLIYKKHTQHTSHYTFQFMHFGLPVWGSTVKVNITNAGNILTYFKNIGDIQSLPANNIIPTIADTIIYKNKLYKQQWKNIYCYTNQQWQPAIVHTIFDANIDSSFIVNNQNQILFRYSNQSYLKKDTVIQGKVFLPDPLTYNHYTYGGAFVDNNDANSIWLSNSLLLKNIPATFDTDSNIFVLQNKYAEIFDYDLPFIKPVNSTNSLFHFTRNQLGFEDVNSLFHITNFHQHLDTIGFASLMNQKIFVDAHGQNFADNSSFTPTGGVPILNMGQGGVDDAEDADVIIHEYSHALSWDANSNTAIFTERKALDEGLCDYFATSYSKATDTFAWANMFTWDGHNEYWDGRSANTPNQYVAPFIQGEYYGAEIWNTAMMKIWDVAGRNATDKMMLQAMYSFTDSTKFPLAASLVIQADSIVNNGANRQTICSAFRSKGIEPIWGCWPVSITDINNNRFNIFINNQLAFANNIGCLQVLLPSIQRADVLITNAYGQTIFTQHSNTQQVLNLPSNIIIIPGVYTITILTNQQTVSQKIVHY